MYQVLSNVIPAGTKVRVSRSETTPGFEGKEGVLELPTTGTIAIVHFQEVNKLIFFLVSDIEVVKQG